MSTKYVTIKKAAQETGYTETAIRSKVDKGIWKEGAEWVRAPDGRILVNLVGYERWVEMGVEFEPPPIARSRSPSAIEVSCVGRGSGVPPLQLT